MSDLPFRSAKQLAAAIRRKQVGCLELLDLYLDRVERHNPAINAVIWIDREGARKRARAADRALAKGEVWGPLHGVPMTIKESFDIAGAPTTWGEPALSGAIARQDALYVQRMKAAGVTLFGKTNVPFMLADWQSFNAVYGTTNNPWDLSRTPGGSSGGSAAALAAGLTGIEAGSDIGASIRNPAHYCGVFGHKPTWGVVSPRGHALSEGLAPMDIAAVGPLGRSADDIEISLRATMGPDEVDGAGWKLALPPARRKTLKGYRIAVMSDSSVCEVDAPYREKIEALAVDLRKAGCKVSLDARPDIDWDELQDVYVKLLRSATSGRQTDAQVADNRRLAAERGPNDQSYAARMFRANVLSHRDWLSTDERRHQLRMKWAAFFREWDLLLCPTAASAAWPHDQKGLRHDRTIRVNNREQPTTDQLFWAGLSGVCYLPGTVAPIGLANGLPVGVQIVGPQHGDFDCINFARLIEREFGGFAPPPGYDA